MPQLLNDLPRQRILSLDAFRGITFVLMLYVNFLAGAQAVPAWLLHADGARDGMGLADIVFPCFLFAVGMSIPFGVNSRIARGDSDAQVIGHSAYRALALIVMGVFMVNAESGYSERAMGIPIAAWSLAFYAAVGLTWGAYRVESVALARCLRGLGVVLLAGLALAWRGDGGAMMSPQWWGILGLIGWAYLAVAVLYQLARGALGVLLGAMLGGVALFMLTTGSGIATALAGHATHSVIVLAGLVCALLFFDGQRSAPQRLARAACLAALLAAAGAGLHHWYPVSKIGATPPWALYCGALGVAAFALLYWLVEVLGARRWTVLVEPAATSPLVTYLLPFVIGATISLAGAQFRPALVEGGTALLAGAVFSATIVLVVARLNIHNCKLKI
jgi:heparan-alpha-glucosaminide N-acetyltransferase